MMLLGSDNICMRGGKKVLRVTLFYLEMLFESQRIVIASTAVADFFVNGFFSQAYKVERI